MIFNVNLKNYILPAFHARPIESITAGELVAHLQSIPYAYTAAYTLDNIKRIYRHAVNMQLLATSPAELLKASELLPAHQGDAMRHITDPSIIGKALLAIERAHPALPATRAYMRLLPYLFTRPSELRKLEWQELDMEVGLITIPAHRMKKRRPHIVPLPRQAKALIEEMRIFTGRTPFIFANDDKPITEGAAYKIMKSAKVSDETSLYHLTTLHGWRHTASTLLHEQGYPSHIVEMQLAHADKNSVRGTYNHADYLKERQIMMQKYADYLDNLKAKAL
ncbi:tyrosine-type recombinase/integrase [Dichelobacter nodosus]|uniref:tyrosine-type recombinase/integrase n=1 Tax=Dichelobacter nodosus TaxID=870 RepID=UPI0002D5A5A8|nr:site-specific integrase [Dichelobacter nodosus]AXM45175.1 integrase [Dichelobacter nodosus]TGA66020.1 integrase [Dichelobacter nodosus]